MYYSKCGLRGYHVHQYVDFETLRSPQCMPGEQKFIQLVRICCLETCIISTRSQQSGWALSYQMEYPVSLGLEQLILYESSYIRVMSPKYRRLKLICVGLELPIEAVVAMADFYENKQA